MKPIRVIKDDNNILESHILGDFAADSFLADYEFPGFSGFYAYLRLDEYNIRGIDEGHLFIFLDLLGYYSEEYGEYSLVPMIYYTKDELEYIIDDFNEANAELQDIASMYMLDDGQGFEIDNDTIRITSPELLKFFMSFDNDIKEVNIYINEIKENGFATGGFKIIK